MHPAFRVGEEAISVSLKLHESDAMTLAGTPIERIVIEIGRTAVLLRTSDHKLAKMLLDRYNGFVTPAENVAAEFEIESHDGGPISSEQEVSVRWKNDQWIIERGDFRVRWSPRRRAGTIRQAASPFATDSALRIVHSLVLASEGGFLLHAASAIRNGRAFLFAGASGAGKTTMLRFLALTFAQARRKRSSAKVVKNRQRDSEKIRKAQERVKSEFRFDNYPLPIFVYLNRLRDVSNWPPHRSLLDALTDEWSAVDKLRKLPEGFFKKKLW